MLGDDEQRARPESEDGNQLGNRSRPRTIAPLISLSFAVAACLMVNLSGLGSLVRQTARVGLIGHQMRGQETKSSRGYRSWEPGRARRT